MNRKKSTKKVTEGLKQAAQDLATQFQREAQAQAPFDANIPNWVCGFGIEYLGVGTLEQCLEMCLDTEEESEILAVQVQCLEKGCAMSGQDEYGMPVAPEWDIQWNPKRAAQLREWYAFHVEADGSLCVAP